MKAVKTLLPMICASLIICSSQAEAECASYEWNKTLKSGDEGNASYKKAKDLFGTFNEHFFTHLKNSNQQRAIDDIDIIYEARAEARRAKSQNKKAKRGWTDLYNDCDGENATNAKKNIEAIDNNLERIRRMLAGDEDEEAWKYDYGIVFRLNALLGVLADNDKMSKVVQHLITKGADVNTANGPGEAPLILAIKAESNVNAIAFLNAGADIEVDYNDYIEKKVPTPLIMATLKGNAKIVRELVKRGAKLNHISGMQETPVKGCSLLDLARLSGNDDIYLIYKDRNVKSTCPDVK